MDEPNPYDLTPTPEQMEATQNMNRAQERGQNQPNESNDDSSGGGDEPGFLSSLFNTLDTPEDSTPPADPQPNDPRPENDEGDETPPDGTDPKETSTKDDDDLLDAPANLSEKNKIGWKELKSLKKQVEQERDRLKAELETVKSQPPVEVEATKAELEQARQQLEEYESRMAMINVEQSREYQESIAKPLAAAESMIQEYAKAYELDIPQIAAAAMQTNILERNKMLSEMTAGMNDFDKLEFKKLVDDAQGLFARAQQAKANANESLAYIEQQRQVEAQKAQQKFQQAHKEAAAQMRETLTKKLPFLAETPSLFNDAENADLTQATPDVQAYAKHAAVLLPTLLEKFNAQGKRIAELEASIAKRSSGGPSARSGGVSSTPDSSSSGEDFMSGLEKALNLR
jgi:hypothetical protein